MADAFPAIITNGGLSDALNATNNGWTINVIEFSVASTAGALNPARATPNTEVYRAAIAGYEVINQNQVKIVCEIPANAEYPGGNVLSDFDINEVYLYTQNDYVTLTYSPGTGLFARPESVTSSGGAVGTVISNSITGGVGTLVVKVTTGTFVAAQTLLGGTSSATGTISAVTASPKTLFWIGQPSTIPYYPISTVSFEMVITYKYF
jgi:hypothetical protein